MKRLIAIIAIIISILIPSGPVFSQYLGNGWNNFSFSSPSYSNGWIEPEVFEYLSLPGVSLTGAQIDALDANIRAIKNTDLVNISTVSVNLEDTLAAYNTFKARVVADGGTIISKQDIWDALAHAYDNSYYASLSAWYSPTFALKNDGSARVHTVYDLSPNNKDATQTNGSYKSPWPTSTRNGKYVFTASAVYKPYYPTGVIPPASATIISVMKPSVSAETKIIFGARDSDDERSFLGTLIGKLAGGVSALNNTQIYGNIVMSGAWVAGGLSYDGTTIDLYNTGFLEYSLAQTASVDNTTQGYYLGAYNDKGLTPPSASLTWNNLFADALIISPAVSAATIAAISSFLNSKYAITSDQRWLMTLGDSKTLTNGWQPGLEAALETATGSNWIHTYGGSTHAIADYVTELPAILNGAPPYSAAVPNGMPDAPGAQEINVLLNIGVHDLAPVPPEATFKENYLTVINQIRAKWPTARIFGARGWTRNYSEDCNTIATWIEEVQADNPTLFSLGHDERVWLEGGDNGATMTEDGTHYSAAGNVEAGNQWKLVLGY